MSVQYEYIEIPGTGQKIAVPKISDKDRESPGVRSPDWMIQIDDLLQSNVEGFEDHAELYGWHGQASRLSSGDVGGAQLFTSATLKHSDLILLIANGGHGAEIEKHMNMGIAFDKVQIVRLGNIMSVKLKLQVVDFTTCRIQTVQQLVDNLVITMQVGSRTNTIFVYGPDGSSKGQMVSSADYQKNTAS